MKCGDVYFSLLWDSRENYEEWLGSGNGRGEYITDLNLEYLYEEIQRLSGYGEQYDWEKIFLHPCTRVSTVLHRQGIMQRLWEDPSLYGAARDFISSVSGMRKKMGRVCGMNDERKKRLCFLQAAETFFTEMEGLYERTDRGRDWKPGLAEGIRRLADCIAGSSAKKERAVLSDCLQKLCRYAPQNLILNKDKTQPCHNIVIVPGPPKNILDSYTGRLREAAEFFLGEYDFSIDVYQDMDITCLDQKLMEYTYAQAGETRNEIDIIYEKYRDFDFFPFISLADELVFYLSCIHFRREYEKEGFYFTMPCFGTERTCVKGAYDMLLGVNLFKNGEGCRPVSNDYAFHRGASWFILTGANQGGKTTFIRSIGLIQCLAQTGMFVPAEEAILKAVGHIHTF